MAVVVGVRVFRKLSNFSSARYYLQGEGARQGVGRYLFIFESVRKKLDVEDHKLRELSLLSFPVSKINWSKLYLCDTIIFLLLHYLLARLHFQKVIIVQVGQFHVPHSPSRVEEQKFSSSVERVCCCEAEWAYGFHVWTCP